MNDAERRAIEAEVSRLIILYARLNDEGRWHKVADLFAEDGRANRPTAPESFTEGREALRASFLARPPRIARHVCTNIMVTVESPTVATAWSLILLFTGKEDPAGGLPIRDASSPLVGEYRDRLVLTPEGWRFAERRGSLSFAA